MAFTELLPSPSYVEIGPTKSSTIVVEVASGAVNPVFAGSSTDFTVKCISFIVGFMV